MKTKHLLMTLLLALMVPLAAFAQVERTATDGPTSTVETNQTRAITDNNSPIHIRYANFVTTNSAWIVFDCDLEYNFHVNNVYSGQYYIRYKTESMSNWSEERSFSVQYNGGTPYCNFAYVCSITPYTRYTVQIRCYIDNAYCEWSDEFSFATLCPVTATPYNIDFNGLSALPQYWRVETGTGNACSVANDQLSVSTTSGNPLDAYVILPYFENLATLQLSFNAARTAGSCNEMQVGIMTDPFDANTFSPLQTLTLSEATTTYGSSLLEASTQHGHIAIKLNDATEEQHSVWFDDFAVTRLQALDNLAVDVTNSSATLSWTTIAPSVQIQYREADGTWSASITPEGNPYTITGLTESTNYEARIRANFTTFNSDWVSFGTFKTLMQEAYTMGASANHTYTEGFETTNHGWILNNGASMNYWCHSWGAGILAQFNPNVNSNKSIYITDGTTTGSNFNQRPTWQYTKMNENQLQNIARPSIVYLTKIFNLSAGQYTFNFDYKVMGKEGEDYLRVFLLPADIELEGTGNSSVFPNGYQNWYYLDNGTQVAQTPNNNTVGSEYVSFGEGSNLHNVVNVYEGGDIEPGNYMMVFAWRNIGSTRVNDAVQYPAAIDNVSVTWSSLVYPPEVSYEASQATDTEAPMYLFAPSQGIAPTSYEVQYEPALDHNDYDGAPIASFDAIENPQSATLTGLTPNTLYNVRIRSVYTANGHSVYSDWGDYASMFTTKYPRPTHLVVVGQTSSWANVRWNPVEMTRPEGQYINYCVQLTTDLNDWGEEDCGWASDSWEKNLAPGTYHFRVRTAVYQEEGNLYMGGSDWSEPITFTIAPWTDPVTIFPLTYDFEEWSNHFADGLTLDGDYDYLDILTYGVSDVPTPEEGDNEYALRFRSTANKTACLVLPPLRPSTSSALVSFWWYHNSSDNNAGEGVVVEYSSDGSSWTSFGDVIPRYAAETGWVKYQKVVPTLGTNASYIRLRFIGSSSNQWSRYCYLDDLTVHTLKSEKPYISYVGCNGNSATITLYDYAVENGYYSSAFEVQYREWRDPSETQETWVDYDVFVNQEPYAFVRTLTVNGLQPATCYEFRARARVSFGGYDFDWSGYCEPVRQWTDCGTYTITPSYTFTEGFEDEFYLNCWTADEGWEMQHEGGHSGAYCAYLPANTNSKMAMPLISSSGCNNVIIRFWSKGPGKIYAYYGQDFGTSRLVGFMSNTTDWVQYELSISYLIKNNAPLKISFEPDLPYGKAWYLDDIEIVANAYDKVFDPIGASYVGAYESNSLWFPNGVPTAEDNVMIMGSAKVGFSETTVVNTAVGNVAFSHHGSLSVNKSATLTANRIDATKQVTVYGTANVTTLNAAKANSVVVKNGGVLYAAAITGTEAYVTDRVVVEDGGQLKTDQEAFVTIKKNIGSYTAIEAENNVTRGGYYLISSPLNEQYFNPAQAGACTYETEGGEWTYDLYEFNYEYEGAEWRNYKQEPFYMTNGRGFLYASRDGVNLTFPGRIFANHATKYFNPSYGEGATYDFNGWNLMGNPFSCDAYITYVSAPDAISFYRMNPSGSGFIAAMGAIKPMEGVFVRTTMTGQGIGFNRDEPTEPGSKLGINLMQGNVLVDNAIIRFGQGGTLPKFSFSNNTSKVYIPMADDDYAVVSSQPVGVLPLNFEAAKDGTYTLSFEDATEGLLYCHLIDNLTGADVDLLSAGDCGSESAMTTEGVSYTFTAKTTDYASRFRVVFAVAGAGGGACEPSFAFNNNGNWIIANEGRATLQVIDLNGRILSSEQIEGSAETRIDAVPGLYLIRLINGENVKVQKVVVR